MIAARLQSHRYMIKASVANDMVLLKWCHGDSYVMNPVYIYYIYATLLPEGLSDLPNEFWDSCVEALFSKKAVARKQTVLLKTCPECPVNTPHKDSLIWNRCFFRLLHPVMKSSML